MGVDGLRSFNRLQKRLGRKQPGPSLLKKEPVQFMAYDLLKLEENDLRELPFEQRRKSLENLINSLPTGFPLRISPRVVAKVGTIGEAGLESRDRGVEGLMLKQMDSVYSSEGEGDWYKWKVDPFVADMVVVGAGWAWQACQSVLGLHFGGP